jgi:hypothetical protein
MAGECKCGTPQSCTCTQILMRADSGLVRVCACGRANCKCSSPQVMAGGEVGVGICANCVTLQQEQPPIYRQWSACCSLLHLSEGKVVGRCVCCVMALTPCATTCTQLMLCVRLHPQKPESVIQGWQAHVKLRLPPTSSVGGDGLASTATAAARVAVQGDVPQRSGPGGGVSCCGGGHANAQGGGGDSSTNGQNAQQLREALARQLLVEHPDLGITGSYAFF